MIDREHDEYGWGIPVLLLLNAYYWVCVYWYGFFVPTMWTIVIAAIVGLYFRLTGRV